MDLTRTTPQKRPNEIHVTVEKKVDAKSIHPLQNKITARDYAQLAAVSYEQAQDHKKAQEMYMRVAKLNEELFFYELQKADEK